MFMNSRVSLKRILWTFILLFGAGWALVALLALTTKQGGYEFDTRFTEFEVCLTPDRYYPVKRVPVGAEKLFVCGLIEGSSSSRPGILHWLKDGNIVYSEYFDEPKGYFFKPVKLEEPLVIGRYRAEIFYDKQVIAAIEFKAD